MSPAPPAHAAQLGGNGRRTKGGLGGWKERVKIKERGEGWLSRRGKMLPAQTRPSHTCWVFLAELLTNSPLPINCYLCPRLPHASEIQGSNARLYPRVHYPIKLAILAKWSQGSRKNLPTFTHNSGSAKASPRPRAPSSSTSQPRAESRCHFVHLMLVKHGSPTVQPRRGRRADFARFLRKEGTGGQLCAFGE